MSHTLLWFAVALALCVLEVVTVDLVFASLALGAFVGGLSAACGGDLALDVVFASCVALASLIFVRPVVKRHLQRKPDARTGISALIGQNATVETATTVRLNGEIWTLTHPLGPEVTAGDLVRVRAVRGASLDVGPMSEHYTGPATSKDDTA